MAKQQLTFVHKEDRKRDKFVCIVYWEGRPTIDQDKVKAIQEYAEANPDDENKYTNAGLSVDFMTTICSGKLDEVIVFNLRAKKQAVRLSGLLMATICDNIVTIPSKTYTPDELRAIYKEEAFPPPPF